MRRLILIAIATVVVPQAQCADKQGNYEVGGGVGSVTCAKFLDAMATARQLGGVSSIKGLPYVVAYMDYIDGFQTGFNLEAPGVYDVFAKLPGFDPLFAVEPWCKDHPDKRFGMAVVNLALKLTDDAK